MEVYSVIPAMLHHYLYAVERKSKKSVQKGELDAPPGNEINDPSAKITHSYILENSTAVSGYGMIEPRRGCILHAHDSWGYI